MDDPFPDAVRVLHVDDEPDVAELTATFLQRENERFSVETATGPEEGLGRLAEADFDCVVSDYDMPGRNGIEFLEAVRDRYPNLPFVLFTGKGSEEVASEAISAGVTDYLQKGADTDQYTVLANRIANAVEQYHSRRALRDERAFVDQALDTLEDIFYVVDTDLRIRRWNERLTTVTGYDDETIEGMAATACFPEDARDRVRAALERALESGGTSGEAAVLTAGGERIPYEFTTNRLTDTTGDVVGLVGVGRDVSERRERERETAFFTRLVETVGVGVAVYGDDGRYEYVNKAYASLLETDVETLTGTPIWSVNPDVDREQFAAYWDSFEDGETRIDETVHRLGETEVPVRTVTTRQSIRGTTYNFGTITDITERKAREREIRRQNERLDSFASIVSHDLRNPLQIAQGRLDLAARECDSDYLDEVANAHERMNALITDLLTLAREGEAVHDPETVALAEAASECWETVETGEAEVVTETDRTIVADPRRLRQLFENLFRNSVEHGDGAPAVRVGDLEGGFYVEDDGPGIPPGDRDRVFESGWTTDENGTGFGLAIVKAVADAHGWDITVTGGTDGVSERESETREGEHSSGARFEITGVDSA